MSEETKPTLTFKIGDSKKETEASNSASVPLINSILHEAASNASNSIPEIEKSILDIKKTSEDTIKKIEEQLEPKKPVSKMWLVLVGIAVIGVPLYWFNGAQMMKDTMEYMSKKVENIPKQEPLSPPIEVVQEERKPKKVVSEASVQESREYYVRIQFADDRVQVRTGGSRSWRLNNPCSILYGKFSVNNGAIGKSEKYAVFEKYDAGRKACYNLLFTSNHGYKDLSILRAMNRFAPPNEGFKVQKYTSALTKAKFNLSNKMNELSEARREKLIDILMDVEDFIPGKIKEFEDDDDFEKRGF